MLGTERMDASEGEEVKRDEPRRPEDAQSAFFWETASVPLEFMV